MNLPPKRRLPPCTSAENIRIRTNKVLKEKGVENHFQAEYFAETAKLLKTIKDRKYDIYKGSIKSMKTQAWKISYEFCIEYLKRNNQNQTISTIVTEMGKKQVEATGKFTNDKNELSSYFEKLMNISRTRLPIPFAKRVKQNARFQELSKFAVPEESETQSTMISAPNLPLPHTAIDEEGNLEPQPEDKPVQNMSGSSRNTYSSRSRKQSESNETEEEEEETYQSYEDNSTEEESEPEKKFVSQVLDENSYEGTQPYSYQYSYE